MKFIWDKLALFASALCMVHCLLSLPMLSVLAVFPLTQQEAVHPVMALIAVALGAPALALGYRRHRLMYVVVVGIAGLALLLSSLVFEHAQLSHVLLTVIGLFLLIGAHISNWRCARAASAVAAAASTTARS